MPDAPDGVHVINDRCLLRTQGGQRLVIVAGKAVPRAGVILAVAALIQTGVFGYARDIYGTLGPAFYGLRTSLMTMLLMALLRIKRPEALKEHSPAALDRAPEVKTPRRKLARLAAVGRAADFGRALDQRRIAQHGQALGFLYLDSMSGPTTASTRSPRPRDSGWPNRVPAGPHRPLMKLMVIGSLRGGAVLHTVRGNYYQHEMRLFHLARPTLLPNEIVIYDRATGHFVSAAQVRAQGADLISRVAKRKIDWRKGRRLGTGDLRVEWTKTLNKPKYLSEPEWAQLPEKISVRVIRVFVSQKGYRTRELTLAATPLDPALATRARIMPRADAEARLHLPPFRQQSPRHASAGRARIMDRISLQTFTSLRPIGCPAAGLRPISVGPCQAQ